MSSSISACFTPFGCQTVSSFRRELGWIDSGLLCELDVGLRATVRGCLQEKGAAGLRIGGACSRIHVLPGRSDEKARQIGADEGRAAQLFCRHTERAQALALRRINIDAARAPAGVPDITI